jgi:hypothetical protein
MSLVCPEDAAAWGAANRVKLYPDQSQTWILAAVVTRGGLLERSDPDDRDVRRMARAVLGKWFSDTPGSELGSRSGGAADIKIGAPTSTHPELAQVDQKWTQLPGPLPLLRAGRLVYVPVTFSWRSRETSRPWPTRRVNWGFGGPCPVDADWALITVGNVQQAAPEAPEPSPLERMEQAAEAVASPLRWIGPALVLFGLGYVIVAVRPR